MLKLGKINREKKCKIIQKSTKNLQINIYKYEQLFGGGIVSTDTLNSEAIIVSIKDYNNVSTEVL